MRLVTWNVYRGDCFAKAAMLDHLDPDIIVLQECGRPSDADEQRCQWFGSNPQQGVAFIARNAFRLLRHPISPDLDHSVFPVRVTGPISFGLLGVWAMPRPSYVGAVDRGLTTYAAFLADGASVVAGDFNNHWRWDEGKKSVTFAGLYERLASEFGLTSAYHGFHPDIAHGDEAPTLYWQWKAEQGFHIDYVFVPSAWHVTHVDVGTFEDWEVSSDHRPVVVDVDLPR